jgi:Berberine and berberine like
MSHDMRVPLNKRVRENYGLRSDRLAELKHRYDPANLLPLNPNTTPAVAS